MTLQKNSEQDDGLRSCYDNSVLQIKFMCRKRIEIYRMIHTIESFIV